MDKKIIEFNKSLQTKKIPALKVGDIVRVHKRIREGNKERVQVFKGLVIAVKGKQSSSPTITVRRESEGVGVEATFPVYLPTIEKIDLLRHSKVRRSKLYYMRKRTGRAAKMKTRSLDEKEKSTIDEIEKEKKTSKKQEPQKQSEEKPAAEKKPEKTESKKKKQIEKSGSEKGKKE